MNIEQLRDYCLSFKGVTEGFPFDEHTLVFKVGGKMFALSNVDDFVFVNLKCEPEEAQDLRARYEGIRPGYHMNKKTWNSVYVNSDVDDELLKKMIELSYTLVFDTLTKKKKSEIQNR